MKATGKSGDAHTPESEDIAKLLRALNEDLKADPIDAAIDLDEDDEERHAARGLPLGKIAAALLAAAGIGVAVVMLDPGGAPTQPTEATALVAPAPAITRAPAPQPSAAAPESMIARAPAPSAAPVAPPVSTAPAPPPAVAAPLTPPPALRVPEPPALPPTATVTKPVPAVRQAEALLPPVTPAPRAEAPRAEPETPPSSPPPAAPVVPKAAETGELQAMLAPPKEPRDTKRVPAKPTDSKAVEAKPAETKPAAPVVPKAAAGKPLVTIPGGPYAVQTGTFKVAENAESLTRRLQGNGFSAYTLAWTDKSSQSWHAVRVGGYADSAAAKRAAGELKAKFGIDSVVVATH
ncbi:SPOR domain-containing protein [Azospirillum doebereinerae]|uniref:SPOR domain-containing protein n=2 Tax=Azospirillum doebereinerae TaxID=92933 RepID=UPI00384B2D8D